jgi:hypothetical protein
MQYNHFRYTLHAGVVPQVLHSYCEAQIIMEPKINTGFVKGWKARV